MMPILSEITQCMQKLYLMLLEIYLQIFGPFPPPQQFGSMQSHKDGHKHPHIIGFHTANSPDYPYSVR